MLARRAAGCAPLCSRGQRNMLCRAAFFFFGAKTQLGALAGSSGKEPELFFRAVTPYDYVVVVVAGRRINSLIRPRLLPFMEDRRVDDPPHTSLSFERIDRGVHFFYSFDKDRCLFSAVGRNRSSPLRVFLRKPNYV